jgi:hypothetical protein
MQKRSFSFYLMWITLRNILQKQPISKLPKKKNLFSFFHILLETRGSAVCSKLADIFLKIARKLFLKRMKAVRLQKNSLHLENKIIGVVQEHRFEKVLPFQ